jgi:hypothetical protein
MKYRPELYYFFNKLDVPVPAATNDELWGMLNPDRLWNLKIIQDLILPKMDEEKKVLPKQFGDNAVFQSYTKYIIKTYGLGGLFTPLRPIDIMEGYTDLTLKAISETPPEAGGDPTIDPFLSINHPGDQIKNMKQAMFTGVDEYRFVRNYQSYNMDSPYLRLPTKETPTLRTIKDTYFNPWPGNVPVNGTDASQFPPQALEGGSVYAFVSDLMRTV